MGIDLLAESLVPRCRFIVKFSLIGLLWRTGLLEALAKREDGHAFHISRQLCTGLLQTSVGVVGNMGIVAPFPSCFSKYAVLHSRDLEKRTYS